MPVEEQGTPHEPATGTLMVDTGRGDRVGEFRGAVGPYWLLRPVRGGREWEAPPERVRVANFRERIDALNSLRNARSRGEVL
ncbi:hypothetical protein [Streptomyces sp. NPDC054784]